MRLQGPVAGGRRIHGAAGRNDPEIGACRLDDLGPAGSEKPLRPQIGAAVAAFDDDIGLDFRRAVPPGNPGIRDRRATMRETNENSPSTPIASHFVWRLRLAYY